MKSSCALGTLSGLMRLLSISLLSLLPGCHQKPEPVAVQTYSVPAELESYVQAFHTEATSRSQSQPVTNLVMAFGPTSGADVCGQCVLDAGQPPRIVLNADCWKRASPLERECLVFHELGHCLLSRNHRTERFANKAYVSLMNPDAISIYAPCDYPIGDDVCDKRPRRSYYLDELFNPNTPAPVWGK